MKNKVAKNRRLIGSGLGTAIVAASLVVLSACNTGDDANEAASLLSESGNASDRCSGIMQISADNIEVTSAEEIPPGAQVPGAASLLGTPIEGLPAFCRVQGRAIPTPESDIGFEVWLPSDGWDGRLHGIGIGGFAGIIDYGSLATAVRAGQVGMATDTGHKGQGPHPGVRMMDSSWAKDNPERIQDYGSRGVHESTVAAKKIIEAFYERGPDYSYFVGCSGGGRQGLMEAARHPEDYDGILAGAPAQSWTGLSLAMTNAAQAQLQDGAAIRADQMQLLEDEIVRQCDAVDGLEDRLIWDPRKCEFDTSQLVCGVASGEQCFSLEQRIALDRIFNGPRNASGESVGYTYVPSGSEAGPLGWAAYLATDANGNSGARVHADGLYGDFMPDAFASVANFDFDTDPVFLKEQLSDVLDAPADLNRYIDEGGKLIMWHGWADAAIPPELTIDYFDAVKQRSGSNAENAVRLFMVPNVQHCWGGNGPASFGQNGAPPPGSEARTNMVLALQEWVEKGRDVQSIVGAAGGAGFHGEPPASPVSQTLLCAAPKIARLKEGADPASIDSYYCAQAD